MYVVRCADDTLYTGYAVDVEKRVKTHNLGQGAKYTKSRRPVELVAKARFSTKHDAMRAEYMFKRLDRDQKLALINSGVDSRINLKSNLEGDGSKVDGSKVDDSKAGFESSFEQLLRDLFF